MTCFTYGEHRIYEQMMKRIPFEIYSDEYDRCVILHYKKFFNKFLEEYNFDSIRVRLEIAKKNMLFDDFIFLNENHRNTFYKSYNSYLKRHREDDIKIAIMYLLSVSSRFNQNEQEKVYEEIVDSETGEKVIAEVQENEPIEEKPSEPPEKPKAKGSYTNPQSPPTYTNEQTVVEKNTSKTVPVEKEQAGVKKGKVYIEGFGYVDDEGGDSTAIKGTSDGDINKMVGVMD